MVKLWLGGRAYQIDEKTNKAMNEHINKQIVPTNTNPTASGKLPPNKSEDIALEFLKSKGIEPMALLVLVGFALTLLLDSLIGTEQGTFAQLLLAAITTGAGVNTVTPSQSQVDSDIMIGDIDTTPPIRGLKVNIDGDTTIDVQGSQVLMAVFSKLSQFMTGSGIIGVLWKISTGRIKCNSAVITFTNDAATTPAVYWNSQRGQYPAKPGRPIRAKSVTAIQNAPWTINGTDFAYLAVTDPANITSVDITFADGTQQNFTVVEVDGLFAKTNETEANGRLATLASCFDNTKNQFSTIRINVGATAVQVMIVQ